MHQVQDFAQAYTQAPWRKQLQLIGLFLLIVAFVGLVAGIYLNVTARAATVGREIFDLQNQIDEIERENENLRAQLAELTSSARMAQRAQSMGFYPVTPDETLYLVVPGYEARKPLVLAPARQPTVSSDVRRLPPEFRESIFSWLQRQSLHMNIPWLEAAP